VISVVVPTFNRAERLPRLVAALEAQTTTTPFEVVVVNDGSTDATEEVLASLAAGSTVPLRILRTPCNGGPAGARDLGWRAATGDWIVFTDDDCTPEPGWLAALDGRFGDADLVQGRTVLAPPRDREPLFGWAPEVSFERGFYETCNIAYRRATLEAVDGFDTGFGPTNSPRARYRPPQWGEDTDLALRAKRGGAVTAFADDAVVVHDRRTGTLRERLADAPRRAGLVTIIGRYPELRACLHDPPYFNDRAHRWVLVGALGGLVVLARPRRLSSWAIAMALALPWVQTRGVHVRRREWPSVLPRQLLVDVADVAVMAAASIRERTLVL
jgi:glycosyltransferase involved in cell wall biosynthesis